MTNDYYRQINAAALPCLSAILSRLNVQFRHEGAEIKMLNPKRPDQRFGSFSINRNTGRWSDFATGDRGGDVIALVAYLKDRTQSEAARDLAQMLGVKSNDQK